tara:strand:- start:2015 stop:2878 length:864 start_codon:yes stop_codon:yes gene_type:complete
VKSIDLIELDYLSTLEIIGEGSIDLLQGQITSDMEKVTESQNCLGALCNVKGRVESSFLIVKKPKFEDGFLLIGNREVMKTTETILQKYSQFYQLEMRINDDFKFIAIDESFLSLTFPETDLNLKVQNHEDFVRIHYLTKRFHLLILEKGSDCFENEEISSELNEWEKDNIVNKDFNIKPEDSNKYTPHELGYHQTNRIDFEKGCYTGQEIVARMHYRAKKLPFLLTGSLDANERMSPEVINQEGKKAGTLLSTAKEKNTNLYLISMNKNYDNGEIKFEDSSVISIK